jgi:molybdate transport system regulatory protein
LKPRLYPYPSPLEADTRFRVHIKHATAIGPGKADILQGIADTGSIAEAGRRLGMSYQRVWSLVQSMNGDFIAPLVEKQRGGRAGGGARLSPTGETVLAEYREMERAAQLAIVGPLARLQTLMIKPAAGPDAPVSPEGTQESGAST